MKKIFRQFASPERENLLPVSKQDLKTATASPPPSVGLASPIYSKSSGSSNMRRLYPLEKVVVLDHNGVPAQQATNAGETSLAVDQKAVESTHSVSSTGKQEPPSATNEATSMARRGRTTNDVKLPLHGHDLKNCIDSGQSPELGEIPGWLRRSTPATNSNSFSDIDKLVDQLRKTGIVSAGTKPVLAQQGLSALVERHIDTGGFGHVYKLSDGHHTCVLKIARSNNDIENFPDNSSYQEAANGLFLTAHGITKDVSIFHAANPVKGWSLMEYVSPSSAFAQRPGISLEQAGLKISDDSKENRIAGIVRVDMGGQVWPISMSKFLPIGDDPISDMV